MKRVIKKQLRVNDTGVNRLNNDTVCQLKKDLNINEIAIITKSGQIIPVFTPIKLMTKKQYNYCKPMWKNGSLSWDKPTYDDNNGVPVI